MADLRAKTLDCLLGGRVTVVRALGAQGGVPGPQRVEARVASSQTSRPPHTVDRWDTGDWTCTCRQFMTDRQPCKHIAAVALVTGWPTEARR